MSTNCDIKLYDRVKQISNTTGNGNFLLHESVNGFKDFVDVFQHQDNFFYCINDGNNFEIGSGVLLRADYDALDSIDTDQIQRNVITSSASDNGIISFGPGRKEVFVTYPSTHSVMFGSGIASFNIPRESGLAFWGCNNILDYDQNLVWDKSNSFLGIKKSPNYAIDIGGDGSNESMVKASGYYVGPTGLHFPSGNGDEVSYSGGIQYQHFEKNKLLNQDTENVFGLSGIVNEYIYLKQQNAGLFLAGPASGCNPPCSPGFPNFRPITCEDVPCIEEVSGLLSSLSGDIKAGTFVYDSGNFGALTVSNSGLNIQFPRTPDSASSSGNAGDIAWDQSYLYVCVSANSWKRTLLSSW